MPARKIKKNIRQEMTRQFRLLIDEAEAEMAIIGQELVADHEEAVADWEHKPQFSFTQRIAPDKISVEILVFGKYAKIWQYVDQGTKPHEILPRPENPTQRLAFQTGYSAKTAPVAQFHVGTGARSGQWVSAKAVQHPGTKARKFTKTFSDDLQREMARRIENAFRRAERRYA